MYLPERKTNTQGNTLCSALTIRLGLGHVRVCPWHSLPACLYLIKALWHWEEHNSSLIDWANLTGFGTETRRWVLLKHKTLIQKPVLQHNRLSDLSSFMCDPVCVKDDQIGRVPACLSSSLHPRGSECRQRWEDCLVSPTGRISSPICRARGKMKMCDFLVKNYQEFLDGDSRPLNQVWSPVQQHKSHTHVYIPACLLGSQDEGLPSSVAGKKWSLLPNAFFFLSLSLRPS